MSATHRYYPFAPTADAGATEAPSATTGSDFEETFEVLADEVWSRAERLISGETVDGVSEANLGSLDEVMAAVWQGWTVAARQDATMKHRGGASTLLAIVLLRHDITGTWLIGEVTLTYWSQPGVVHADWKTSTRGARLTSSVFHLLGLPKSVHAPTLPALVQELAAQIDRLLGSDAAEIKRYARDARLLLSLDPAAVADVVGARAGAHVVGAVAHEVASVHTLAQLGGLGDITTLLTQAEKDRPLM